MASKPEPTVTDYLSDILTVLESIDLTLTAIQNAVERPTE